MRGQSQTSTVEHEHSVALAFANAIMFGYEGKHFQFTDTATTGVTTTISLSNQMANEVASSTTASTSSEFTKSCPSSSEPYLMDNPGSYRPRVAVTCSNSHLQATGKGLPCGNGSSGESTRYKGHLLCLGPRFGRIMWCVRMVLYQRLMGLAPSARPPTAKEQPQAIAKVVPRMNG